MVVCRERTLLVYGGRDWGCLQSAETSIPPHSPSRLSFLLSVRCFGVSRGSVDKNQGLGFPLVKSFQRRTCVRDDLRVTQAAVPAAVTCGRRCLETKRANLKPLLLQMCGLNCDFDDWPWRVFGCVTKWLGCVQEPSLLVLAAHNAGWRRSFWGSPI